MKTTYVGSLKFKYKKKIAAYTVTFQKFKYNLTLFHVYHVISANCCTLYSKKSLFNTIEIAVIKYRGLLKGNYMH